jgi:hypothetical protein
MPTGVRVDSQMVKLSSGKWMHHHALRRKAAHETQGNPGRTGPIPDVMCDVPGPVPVGSRDLRPGSWHARGTNSVPVHGRPVEKRSVCASVYAITKSNVEIGAAAHEFNDEQDDVVRTLGGTVAGGTSHDCEPVDIEAIPTGYSGYTIVSSDQGLTQPLDTCPIRGGAPTRPPTPTPGLACYVAPNMRAPSTPIPTPAFTPTSTVTATPTTPPTQTATPPVTSTPTDVVVSELRVGHVPCDARDEHVGVDSGGPNPQDMTNWKTESYSYVGGSCEPSDQSHTFATRYVLGAGASVRVQGGPDAADSPPGGLRWTGAYTWANDGDVAVLYDTVGTRR